MKTEIMIITPEIARSFLSMQDPEHKNRRLEKRDVLKMARDMEAGRWRLTHQGIAFDKNNILRDGQHRLNAIVESGCSVPMLVTFGLSDESYDGIDVGRKRDTKDTFALSDDYRDDILLRNNGVIGMVRSLFAFGVNSSIVMSNGEILNFIKTFKPSVESVYRAAISRASGMSTTAPIHAAALAAIISGEQEKDISAFFDCFKRSDISTSENKNVQAPLLWASRIMSAKGKKMSMSKTSLYLGTQNAIWNYCNNTTVSSIAKTPKTERYPVQRIISFIVGAKKEKE